MQFSSVSKHSGLVATQLANASPIFGVHAVEPSAQRSAQLEDEQEAH